MMDANEINIWRRQMKDKTWEGEAEQIGGRKRIPEQAPRAISLQIRQISGDELAAVSSSSSRSGQQLIWMQAGDFIFYLNKVLTSVRGQTGAQEAEV